MERTPRAADRRLDQDCCLHRASASRVRAVQKSGALTAGGTVHRKCSVPDALAAADARCGPACRTTASLPASNSDGKTTIRPKVNALMSKAAIPKPMRGSVGLYRINVGLPDAAMQRLLPRTCRLHRGPASDFRSSRYCAVYGARALGRLRGDAHFVSFVSRVPTPR